MNKSDNINEKETLNSLENLSDEELVSLKIQAVEAEDYFRAHEIKQEQNMRKRLELERERQDEKSQRKERLKSLNDSLQQVENNEELTETVDISDEELESVEDLMSRMDKINSQYDFTTNFGENLIWFKSLDDIEKNEYFHNNEIESKIDFQKHVLNLCRDYLEAHFEYLKSDWIRVDLDDIIDAIRSLEEYADFLDLNSADWDSDLYDLYDRVHSTLNDMKNRCYEYLEL